MNEKSKIVITNNPKVQSFFTSQNNPEIEILFVEKRDEVFTKDREFIHSNWNMLNHTIM